MTNTPEWDNQGLWENFTVADIQSNHPWEITRVTPVDRENTRVKQEALALIRSEIEGLSMQSRRRIEQALNLLRY